MKLAELPESARAKRLAEIFSLPTFGVTAEDVGGHVHYIALDVDADDPGLLRGLVRLLPRGARVWPTHSGRGYHLWIFPSDPLPRPTAKAFVNALAEAISEAFGDVPVELFPGPNGSVPRPLRWIGTVNPKNGLRECFVDLRWPRLRDRCDETMTLWAIRDGLGRTPPAVLVPEAIRRPRRSSPRSTPSVTANAEASEAGRTDQPPARPRTLVDVLLHDPAFAEYVARLAGTTFRGHGKGVPCPLHPPDRHPSAAWYLTPKGWVLFCFHSRLKLELADVLAYAQTGQISQPKGVSRLARIQWAAAESGRLTAVVDALIKQAEEALTMALHNHKAPPVTDDHVYTQTSVTRSPENDPVLRVWRVIVDLCRENVAHGRLTALGHVDTVAERAGLTKTNACKIINWLAAIGCFKKIYRGDGRAQALTLVDVDPVEVQRRARLLGSWRRCNRAHVAKVLGEEVARKIFYGKPDHPLSPRLPQDVVALTQAHLEEASLTPEALAEPATPVATFALNPVDPLAVPEVVTATPPEAVVPTPEASLAPNPSPTPTEPVRVVMVDLPQEEEGPPAELPAEFLQWLQARHPFMWAIVRANPIRLAQAYAEWRRMTEGTSAPNGETPGMMALSGVDPGRS